MKQKKYSTRLIAGQIKVVVLFVIFLFSFRWFHLGTPEKDERERERGRRCPFSVSSATFWFDGHFDEWEKSKCGRWKRRKKNRKWPACASHSPNAKTDGAALTPRRWRPSEIKSFFMSFFLVSFSISMGRQTKKGLRLPVESHWIRLVFYWVLLGYSSLLGFMIGYDRFC